MKIAALQMPTLSLGTNNRLLYYIQMCVKSDVKIVCLGEYVINSFFCELKTMPKSMIMEQSSDKIELLKTFTKENDITIIAPVVLFEKNSWVKYCLRVKNGRVFKYAQQILINYTHWDERVFFANKMGDNFELFSFSQDGLKIAIMMGFETHFDIAFKEILSKKIDLLVVPSACTFDSNDRWMRLLQTRAFLNSVQILRCNRIGLWGKAKQKWDFYGQSCFIEADGSVASMLGAKEELLLADAKKTNKIRNLWGFDKIYL